MLCCLMGAIVSKRAPPAWPCVWPGSIIRLRGGGLPGCTGAIYRRNERLKSAQHAELATPAKCPGLKGVVYVLLLRHEYEVGINDLINRVCPCLHSAYREEAKDRSLEHEVLNGMQSLRSAQADSLHKDVANGAYGLQHEPLQ
jgi:hypothetical protein